MADADTYHVRVRGRVLGPYDTVTLQGMVRQGRLARHNEVSADGGATWIRAENLPDVFVSRVVRRQGNLPAPSSDALSLPPAGDDESSSAVRMDEATWHFSCAGENHGPVRFTELQTVALTGGLSADDLVWCPDFTEWKPAREVQGLFLDRNASGRRIDGLPSDRTSLDAGRRFCMACGVSIDPRTEICLKCGVRQPQWNAPLHAGAMPSEPPGAASGKAVASLVLGILGLLLCIVPILGLVLSIVGLSLGTRDRRTSASGVATAGVVLSILGTILSALDTAYYLYVLVRLYLPASP